MKPRGLRTHRPLSVKIVRDVLTIEIGAGVLAQAFTHSEYVDGYFEDAGQPVNCDLTIDNRAFAGDVLRVLKDEDELGSSMVTRLLDDACAEAVRRGSPNFKLFIDVAPDANADASVQDETTT